jgi:DNA-binding MurR/RpiR family transcriptional regulator
MAAPLDIISRIKSNLPQFTRSQRKLAELILDSPEHVIRTSVKEFALGAEVSEPTVIRFCRDIGCTGYRDLKIEITQYLAVEQVFAKNAELAGGKSNSVYSGPYADLLELFTGAMASALTDISVELLTEAAQIIIGAKSLHIYAVGGNSSTVAHEAQNRLFRLNVRAVTHLDGYMQRMTAATLGPDDAALFISSTGRPKSLLESAELAKYYGAKSVAITAAASPLSGICDVYLPVKLDQTDSYQQPSPIRYAQLFVLDCLAERVAHLLGDKAREPLKRIHATVTALSGLVPHQPIGD